MKTIQSTKIKNANVLSIIEQFCKKAAFFLIIAFLYFIVFLNTIISTHPGGRRGEGAIFLSAKIAAPFLLLPLLFVLIKRITSRIKYKHLVIFFVVYSLLFVIASYLILKPTFVADAGVVRDIAADISMNDGYMQEYPNNLGYLSFLKVLTRTRIKLEVAMLIVNTLCYALSCYSLLGICDILSFNQDIKKKLLILLALFLPFYFEVLFFYNDMLGISFSIFALLQALKWRKTSQNRYIIPLIISVVLMFAFRQNTLIPLIAIIIFILFTITKKTILASIATLALCFASILLVPLSLKTIYSSHYGWAFNDSNTAPAISFIAMSSMDETETKFGVAGAAIDIPGWWNAYNYFCTIELKEECSNDAKALLRSQLSAYIHNPRRGFLFISKKIASQWTDPTFLLPYAFDNNHVPEQGAITKGRIFYLFCEVVHLAIIVFSALGVRNIAKKQSISWSTLLPLMAVFGYFLFSIIWEAKSRYIMLVFPLLLPFAAYGIAHFKPSSLLRPPKK